MEAEWRMPVPSTAILGSGVKFEKRQAREIGLSFSYEDERHGEERTETIVFESVEAFKCTYLTSLTEESLGAYDCIVDCGVTSWLEAAKAVWRNRGTDNPDVRHLMITFDDGPCYEVLCRGFRVLKE